jgi:RecA/RadA recombinase
MGLFSGPSDLKVVLDASVLDDTSYLHFRCSGTYMKFFNINMQKLGGNAMLVDAEHAFDPAYSKALGVDVENLIVCQPDNGEMALESNFFPLLRL